MSLYMFPAGDVLAAVQEMHGNLELAVRVAEFGSAPERHGDALAITRAVMRMPATVSTALVLEQRLAAARGSRGSAAVAASLMYVAARALVDEQREGFGHILAKLEVNKMEKRLIGFVKGAGMPSWPHSCEFILAPYASASQFAEVQRRYAADHRENNPGLADPDPEGFAGT